MTTDYLRDLGARATFRSRKWGILTVESVAFTPATDGDLLVEIGSPFAAARPTVRIHSECVFAEAFDSELCDCADQLTLAMNRLVADKNSLLVYLRFDGRGAGLSAKVRATALEVEGVDTFDSRVTIGVAPEGRDFTNIGRFLYDRGLRHVTLLTNSPVKADDLRRAGLDVDHEPLLVADPSKHVRKLYETKAHRFDHDIPDSLLE